MQIIKTPVTGKKTPSFWDRLGLAPRPEPIIPAAPAKPAPANSKTTSSVTGKAGASVGGAAPRVTGTVPGVKGTTFPSTSGTAKAGGSVSPAKTIPAAVVTPSAPANVIDPLYIPNEAQKQEANLVAKLPSEFPILQWESMGAIAQQKVMEKSGLSPQDQWRLLNASTPLQVLSILNEIQNNAKSGLLTSGEASKITDQALRYSDDRLRLAHGDASILPPLQKALWNRELDRVFGDLQDKAKGNSKSGEDQPPKIADSPAVKYMLSGNQANAKQKFLMDQTQKSLDLLYKKGTPSQQQVDNIIAGMCTKLLNDSNAPRTKETGVKQTEIPAYTDAVNSLLGRLREDASSAIQRRKQIPISQPYYTERYLGEFIDVYKRNREKGDLNLRNTNAWKAMITDFSPEAPALDGSQYYFVYNGELMNTEDLGNMVYGYYWTGFGIPKSLLYLGAGIISTAHDVLDHDPSTNPNFGNGTLGDDVADRAAIDKGISMFLEGM